MASDFAMYALDRLLLFVFNKKSRMHHFDAEASLFQKKYDF
jgi:hypothetical protein